MKLVISEDNVDLEELKQLLERMMRRMDLMERQLDFAVERLGPVEPEIEELRGLVASPTNLH